MKVEILTDDQAVQDYAFPVEVKIYEDGVQLVPTSATITINDPDGTAEVIAAAMTVAAGVGTLTYPLTATYTADLWENAIIEVDYVIATVHYKAVFFFDVVLNALKCSVIDADLKSYAPLLATVIWNTQTTYDKQIQEAFRAIKRDVKNKGKRPSMLIDGTQIRELIILKTFELICFDFAKNTEDIWWARYQKYRDAYVAAFASLTIKYDEDESGTVDTDEEGTPLGQVTFQR
jgi:hypothetical protein